MGPKGPTRIGNRVWGWTAVALLALGCGKDEGGGDPYRGVIDASGLDAALRPVADAARCPGGPCYPLQRAQAEGTPLEIYNLGSTSGAAFPTGSGGSPVVPVALASIRAWDAGTACTPGGGYDPRVDDYPTDVQFPIFNGLPLAGSGSGLILPLIAVFGIEGLSGNRCNDLKDAGSIALPGVGGGDFGATSTTSSQLYLWAVIDMTARLPVPIGSTFASRGGWYRGLQLRFLDGGALTPDPQGNLPVMDGALVHPAFPGTRSLPTDADAVVLPARPGSPGFSPIVRLHHFDMGPAEPMGTYTAICAGGPCGANEVDMTAADPATSYVLFLVVPQ
jgi:hypothetical protein